MGVTVGMLYPGFGAEDDYPYMAELLGGGVSLPLVHTSVGVDAHEVQALLDLGKSERLLEGAQSLRAAKPDAVMWACTSGSFVFGWDGAHQQALEVQEALEVPASSTSLAFVDAARALGLERVAVAATYPEDVSRHFVALLGHCGIEVTQLVSHDIPTAALAGQLDRDGVLDLARSNDSPDAQAILIPDTALHSARWITDLEAALGKPVLTANQVTVWQGLRLAGALQPCDALGHLFQATAGLPVGA
ncbi:maleate cis-trans isomerase family protein [Arthrobacter globiformis]|uniref:Maleate cis-trans isomerase n=1 Tax=Arthrobacter globiformis TaxID=1665 RepID=A0A328HMV7_ARTGO|nr:aspartate/glutamate racemase family protein [Arthrobacter globiformis]RAM38393.1 maleate cis-trans isomerase [Arthrobacter globiformis]